jgi:hypothetical protein
MRPNTQLRTGQPLSCAIDPHESGTRPPLSNTESAVGSSEAAKILGVSPKTLANWRSLGIGPPFLKYGGRLGPVRYRLADLLAWRDTGLRRPEPRGGSHA